MEEMWMMHHFGEYEGSNSPAFVAMFPNKGGEETLRILDLSAF